MRIAAIDDDPAQLDLVRVVVASMGHDCHLFENANALLRVLSKETFDLFIVDWELPDIPGLDVIRAIRDTAMAPVPILMMTNRSDERDIIEGLNCGADDYMVKSARVGELRARLMALLRRGGHAPAPRERLLSRAHLIEAVWGIDADISSRSLDVYMSHVRSKLSLRAESGYKLVSVYSHGYRLEDLGPVAAAMAH